MSYAQKNQNVNKVAPVQASTNPAGYPYQPTLMEPSSINCSVSGINISTGGTESWGYITSFTSANNNCTPSQQFSGIGNWTGSVGNTGIITYTFNQPISSVTIGYTAANSDDIGTISINGPSPIQLSNPCGATIIGINVIDCNYATG